MKKKLSIALIIIIALIIFIKAELDFNPSVRILASVINFSESTLNSSDYLAYGIDLKDLFCNYSNADIDYSGSIYLKKVKDFPYSISGSIQGQRSSSQKKFSCKSNLDVFVLSVGEMNVFAEESTIYLAAPMLGDTSYSFDTGEDLFPQAPNLNHDINHQWFHENKKNILHFVRSIDIQKTSNTFTDEDGTKAQEYRLVIPQGQGDFIWDLLGMTPPDHDINTSLYLDGHNHARKVVFDLSYKTKGAYVSIYGKNLSTLEIYSPLPDNEEVVFTIKRNGDYKYTNSFSDNITYTTNQGDSYTLDCGVLLNYTEEGIKTEVKDLTIAKGKTTLVEGYMKGKLKPVEDMGDIFKNAKADFSNNIVVDWDTIKNDTASFVDDVISKARENVDLFN